MAKHWTDLDFEPVTDPDVLLLYLTRIVLDRDPVRVVPVAALHGLLTIAEDRGWRPPAEIAACVLTDLGERAAPLRDEGVPCG